MGSAASSIFALVRGVGPNPFNQWSVFKVGMYEITQWAEQKSVGDALL